MRLKDLYDCVQGNWTNEWISNLQDTIFKHVKFLVLVFKNSCHVRLFLLIALFLVYACQYYMPAIIICSFLVLEKKTRNIIFSCFRLRFIFQSFFYLIFHVSYYFFREFIVSFLRVGILFFIHYCQVASFKFLAIFVFQAGTIKTAKHLVQIVHRIVTIELEWQSFHPSPPPV